MPSAAENPRSDSSAGKSPVTATSPSTQTAPTSSSNSVASNSRPTTSTKQKKKKAGKKLDMEENQEGKPSSATNRRVNTIAANLQAQGLTSVVMRGQGMTIVPASVIEDRTISMLDMSSNNLRIIPPEVKRLQHLVTLDLSKNGLRCLHGNDYTGLPRELATLTGLEILIISECNLPFVPPVIWKCENIRVLDISRNKINVLVPEVGNLERLQHLNAQQTSIVTLPPEIAYCQELEEVLLWGNVIESLPDTLKELPKLSCLAINYRSFCCMVDNYMEGLLRKGQIQSEHIPPVLFEMPNLDILDLQETRINSLPDTCVGKLKEFYLAKNFFQVMPKVIMTLQSLKILDISSNMISALPKDLGRLINLEILLMNDNNLDNLPGSLGSLIKLHELAMGGNKLMTIPAQIGQLLNLKTLILDRNSIRSIPSSIVQLKKLETLDLTSNKLSFLPLNFDELTGLKEAHTYRKYQKHGLWLHLNPLRSPPEEVWKTDNPDKIFNYLKHLRIKRTENLQRQKIIVLGESQCGKTSLVRTLIIGKSSLTSGIKDSTPGVDFKAWRTDNDVNFLVNDFGGSRQFRPMYPTLMDPKALYMIVYDHRKYTPQTHEEAIGQWIDLLMLVAPSAVIKVVGTQCDQCYEGIVDQVKEQVEEKLVEQQISYKEKLEREVERVEKMIDEAKEHHVMSQLQYQKQHLNKLLQTPIRIEPKISLASSAPGIRGIPQLISELELLAVNKELFPHAQRAVPKCWLDFCMAMKMKEEFFLRYTHVVQIARLQGIEQKTVPSVLHFLCDIGEILWFHENPNLRELVFQRPVKMIEMAQGIFRHDVDTFMDYDKNRLFASCGQFTRENFQTARDHFNKYGELSRPFLLCFWFYLRLNRSKFKQLIQLMPLLDMCYVVPQSDSPIRKNEYAPLMVIPAFNHEQVFDENLQEYWPTETPEEEMELEMSLSFPLSYPDGVFERMACRIHNITMNRLDWSDHIYADLIDDCKLLMSRGLDPEMYDVEIKFQVRGENLDKIKRNMFTITRQLKNVMHSATRGQTWYVKLNAIHCGDEDCKNYFPREVIHAD